MLETVVLEEELEVLLDEELGLVELVADDVLAVVEELGAAEEAAFGVKLLFPVPKPSAAASLPLPSIVMMSLVSRDVMARWPLALSDATTNAGPELMALMRSPTVSVPVDVYCVMLVPSSMLNVPPGRIPSVDRGVFAVTGTVLVPVAGVGEELDFDDVPEDDVELAGDEESLEEPPSICWMRAVSWDFVRVNASLLAILARPFPRLVSASCMTVMSESSADCAWLCDCACCQ
jgi:hypothetical protein